MSDGPATAELLAAAKDAAARDTDYYALLDLAAPADHVADAPPLTRDAVQRAWRKRSLRYHPDKAGAAFDAAKWEEFGLARDVLASDEARAAYDAARAARMHKQRERDLMNAKQRRFAEELERAEANVAAGSGSTTRTRGAGTGEQGGEGAKQQKNAEEEMEKERQAAEGRRYMEERKRKLREAEERDQARARKEDEERDDRIRALEDQIAEKAKRRAEKRAKREARKSGVGEEEGTHKTKTTTTQPTTTTTTSSFLPVPPPEPNPVTKGPPPPPPAVVDTPMSDDPIQFWETQWPRTKARLLAAQATKEKRLQQGTARAATTA